MNDLSVKYKNIRFINPFILASSPTTRNAEMILRAFKAGWAAAVTKTICIDHESIINVSPRLCGYKSKSALIGLNNLELISERSVDDWIRDISLIKSRYPDRILIASIMAEACNKSGWQKLAELMQNAGADILELNLSCPHGMPERGMGSFCLENADFLVNITKWVKEISKIPVWVKLSPNSSYIAYQAQLCLESGADGITAINTVQGFSGIDVETLNPKQNISGKSSYGGVSGEIIKPVAMKAVSDIAIQNKNCFISAAGGIKDWQDAVEFMLLGASTMQICTEVMFKGYNIIDNMLEGLTNYLDRHGFKSIESLTGLSLDKITAFEALNMQAKAVAEISQNKCISCGKCYTSCNDGGYQAVNKFIQDKTRNIYKINPEKCAGCGLCKIICANDAIELTPLLQKAGQV